MVHKIKEIRQTLDLFSAVDLRKKLSALEKQVHALKSIKTGDAARVHTLRKSLQSFATAYEKFVGSRHPSLLLLLQTMQTFPGMVVPLELRESSDVLMSKTVSGKKLAIEKMLSTVARISKGGDPRWYARGFIISMTESIEHIRMAAKKQREAFGAIRLPTIPLFEEASSLKDSDQIVKAMTQDSQILQAAKKHWDGQIEMMVGYSDSSKEAGVLFSRLSIASALPRLEKVCATAGLRSVFFHGSGGSIDRGGGSIEDQTAWWPRTALQNYKVTVQGEMVERSLATPQITRGQLTHIIDSVSSRLQKPIDEFKDETLTQFAEKVSQNYRAQITSPDFLKLIERATPYSYLHYLKIGSRPSKRTAQLKVSGLRAIPWILCWTQTRFFFPHGGELAALGSRQVLPKRPKLKKHFRMSPFLFRT